MKPKILIIQTGGTLSQEKGEDGAYRPSSQSLNKILEKIPLDSLAEINTDGNSNIDSTNMETSHRANLARMIYKNYRNYDGFVILHGTDTMADTAAALNYMLQNLGKPLVLTGSQKSIFEPGNDAMNNVYNAVKTATKDVGEVIIVFGDKILRGVRTVKESEHGLNAFSSPRVEPVGEIGIDIILKEHMMKRCKKELSLFVDFDTNIELYQQSSGTSTTIFENYVNSKEIHGIVISAYGAGNVQDRLVPYIEKATNAGKPVLVVTNCRLGAADMGIYVVGLAPLKAGAISAGDMTLEAAIQKLMYVVGRANKEELEGKERLAFVEDIIHTEYNKDITITTTRFKSS